MTRLSKANFGLGQKLFPMVINNHWAKWMDLKDEGTVWIMLLQRGKVSSKTAEMTFNH